MMDAQKMYPEGFHSVVSGMKKDMSGKAKHLTHTEACPKYYLTGFTWATQFALDDPNPVTNFMYTQDRSVPEIWNGPSCDDANMRKDLDVALFDPFATDVYYIGNSIKHCFLVRILHAQVLYLSNSTVRNAASIL